MSETLSDHRGKPHWSYSSLDGLLNRCPLQWAFGHIHNLERERAGAALPMGTAFHAAASHLARSRMSGQTASVPEVQEAFSDWLRVELSSDPAIVFEDGETPDTLNTQGRALAALLPLSLPEEVKVMEVASAFSVEMLDSAGNPVSGKPLIGESDVVVMEPDGRITIIDWKTSSKRWAKGKADGSMQATCMAYAHQQLVGGIPSFRFDVFVKNKTPVFESHRTERTQDDFHRLAEMVRTADRIVSAEAFFPRVDWQCGSCPYPSACKEWHRKAGSGTVNLNAA